MKRNLEKLTKTKPFYNNVFTPAIYTIDKVRENRVTVRYFIYDEKKYIEHKRYFELGDMACTEATAWKKAWDFYRRINKKLYETVYDISFNNSCIYLLRPHGNHLQIRYTDKNWDKWKTIIAKRQKQTSVV